MYVGGRAEERVRSGGHSGSRRARAPDGARSGIHVELCDRACDGTLLLRARYRLRPAARCLVPHGFVASSTTAASSNTPVFHLFIRSFYERRADRAVSRTIGDLGQQPMIPTQKHTHNNQPTQTHIRCDTLCMCVACVCVCVTLRVHKAQYIGQTHPGAGGGGGVNGVVTGLVG